MRSYYLKENHIGSAVREIMRYKQTHRLTVPFIQEFLIICSCVNICRRHSLILYFFVGLLKRLQGEDGLLTKSCYYYLPNFLQRANNVTKNHFM